MTIEIPSNSVDKHYEMNPETEELLFDGSKLEPGMIVLIEDSTCRESRDRTHSDPYSRARWRESNYWARVLEVGFTRRHDVVHFTCEYFDGTKKKRQYGTSWAWFVKKNSMPGYFSLDGSQIDYFLFSFDTEKREMYYEGNIEDYEEEVAVLAKHFSDRRIFFVSGLDLGVMS